MVQQPRQVIPHHYEPMYGWALDSRGRPMPIAAAERGAQGYRCPICAGPMIAKKGDVKQHHFAHESLLQCTPDKVAAAIAGQWLVLQLGERMVLKQPCSIFWQQGQDRYTADVLKGVTTLVENLETEYGTADIALMDKENHVRCVLSINVPPDELALTRFVSNGIAVMIMPTERFRSGQANLADLLELAIVRGGWWLLGDKLESGKLLTEPVALRGLLANTVSNQPYRYWSRLETLGERKDVLRLGEHCLWLPPEIWQTVVGGTRHRLSQNLEIVSQDWPQPDGGVVALYYINMHDEDRAVAVRRFRRGEQVQARLHAAYQMRSTTAEDIARFLATG